MGDDKYCEEVFGPPPQKKPGTKWPKTDEKYWPHFTDTLIPALAVACIPALNALFVCTYFAVLKTSAVCRTIFNGKNLSRGTKPPPPVNLMDLRDYIHFLLKWNKPMYITASDIRHWFHQIPICRFLQRLFCVFLTRNGAAFYFSFLVLVMGWSWSPFIAQTLAWTLILGVDPSSPLDWGVLNQGTWTAPPAFIINDASNPSMFVTLLYDNIFFLCDSEVVNKSFKQTLEFNYNRFNIVPKFLQCYTPSDLEYHSVISEIRDGTEVIRDGSKTILVYRGVEIAQKKFLSQYTTMIRVDSTKVAGWRKMELPTDTDKNYVPTYIAKIIGIIIYSCTVHLTALCHVREVIDILSAVGKTVGKDRSNWKLPIIKLTNENVKSLHEAWATVLRNDWVSPLEVDPLNINEKTVWFATDASNEGFGMYRLFASCPVRGLLFSKNLCKKSSKLQNMHIFLRELITAIIFIEIFLDRGFTNLVIAVDNSAAAGVLRRMYSVNAAACERVRRLQTKLEKHKATLTVVNCPGVDNASDLPSHNKDPDMGIVKRCYDIVKSALRGTRSNSNVRTTQLPKKESTESAEITHEEGEVDTFAELLEDLLPKEEVRQEYFAVVSKYELDEAEAEECAALPKDLI